MIKKIFILMFVALTTVGLANPAWAAPNFMASDTGQPITIRAALTDDTYIGANTAMVDAAIDGDLLIGANTAQINGQVEGDLWVGANTVWVNNRVAGDVRIGAGEVVINTTVDDDVIVGARTLTTSEKAVIRGDLIIGAATAMVGGKIYGNARIAGGAVTLNASIDGDVEIKTDNYISILPGTKIGGELSYWAPKENPEFAKYAKTVTYHPQKTTHTPLPPMLGVMLWMIPALGAGFLLWKLVSILLMGAVIIWLMPKLLPRITVAIKKDYWKAFWQGLVVALGIPVLMLVLTITLIGIHLTIAVGLVYGLLLMFGYFAAAILIGSWLVRKFDKTIGRQLGALIVGAILFGLVGIVPLIGWLVCLILMMIGIGGFWQDRYKIIKTGKY
ncbi:hypothetical protein JXA59_00790 [Patescibacteria group bacterium]|nr:hypothetical protein [Patescibacteria group bacterium]